VNIETIAATILFFLGGFYYCYLILDGAVYPAFATWLIFFIAVAISFSSYLLKKGRSQDGGSILKIRQMSSLSLWL
jgi:hypothetical protein